MKYFGNSILIIVLFWAVIAKSECIKPCARNYDPVCGFNGNNYKIFPNKCVLKNAHCNDNQNWLETHMDKCEVELRIDNPEEVQENLIECEIPCTREYMPVCGTDGTKRKIFANKCVLKNEHCKDGHTWFQTRQEDCPEI